MNRQLVRARPELHKETFLKPFHRTTEFCSTCHKVHLPPELNDDRWLRGQNHYDSFRLSGASGHSASSFYYPEKAFSRCADCHMPYVESDDFGARDFGGKGTNVVHDHQFPAANTGLAELVGWSQAAKDKTEGMLKKALRVDLFGLRDGGGLEDPLAAPLRPAAPVLVPGRAYLVEAVVRNLFTGHEFTQGTADSNEVWLALEARRGDAVFAASGELRDDTSVDPRSFFLNAWVIDEEGRRIDRRNPQDIFTVLYNHQLPPGSATLVPFRFIAPKSGSGPVTLTLRARYRKFDTTYVRHFQGSGAQNFLPIVELSADRVSLPIAGDADAASSVSQEESAIPAWQRWNDYGIGLLRQSGPMARGSLAAAASAFAEVEKLGKPDGALNQVRVFLSEGMEVAAARAALDRAAKFDPPSPPWLLAWFEAQVARREGRLDVAIAALEQLIATPWPAARARGFDFAGDDRVWLQLGQIELERAQERPPGDAGNRGRVRTRAKSLRACARKRSGERDRALFARPDRARERRYGRRGGADRRFRALSRRRPRPRPGP